MSQILMAHIDVANQSLGTFLGREAFVLWRELMDGCKRIRENAQTSPNFAYAYMRFRA
jgi:hypothetical protein